MGELDRELGGTREAVTGESGGRTSGANTLKNKSKNPVSFQEAQLGQNNLSERPETWQLPNAIMVADMFFIHHCHEAER